MVTSAQRIPATLARLERVLAAGRGPREIASLGEPALLDFLFQIELRRLIRMGPAVESDGLSPERLVTAARRAAALGVVPVATPLALAAFLERLEGSVHHSGAWRRDRPLWWRSGAESATRPTGRAAELMVLAAELDAILDEPDRAPAGSALAAAFAETNPRPWLRLPGLLPPAYCAALHRELEASFAAGELELERAAVGVRRRISDRRADAVTYLDGFESDLLARLPRLAVLVQWCLGRLLPGWARRLSERPLHPPATAMLARYPGPSGGYRAHLDNPGGDADNGREIAVLLYLNPPESAPVGGDLALWPAGAAPSAPPDERLAPVGGSAVLVDARNVAHQVLPLGAGPARWSLALWLNRDPQREFEAPAQPELSLTEVLLPVAAPPVPAGRLLWHELGDGVSGTLSVHTVDRRPQPRQRVGIVTTVYGAGGALERWCRHHLGLGFDHLVVVFDRIEEAGESRIADRLRRRHPASLLTLWSSAELASRRAGRPASATEARLERAAAGGSSPQAVAARQTLHATAALAAARSDNLGGAPLDWLLHLDADELFYLEGDARGGADLASHFSALRANGVERVRYLNHELLLPRRPDAVDAVDAVDTVDTVGGRVRFKRNPAVAAARLGPTGFERLCAALAMRAADPRPYFNGYLNGKSAVAVGSGEGAAGVHGWRLAAGAKAAKSLTLAGPSVLHYHFASADRYCEKYLAMADDAPPPEARSEPPLFEPCRTESEALARVVELRRAGVPETAVRAQLLELRDRIAGFDPSEVELLEEAGLLLTPEIEDGPTIDGPVSGGAPRVATARPAASVGASRAGSEPPVRTVGILGGGTAGYLAALALARWLPDLRVTLIESSAIPVIGVGEATTPLLPQFLHVDLGLDVAELFAAVRPTLKLGIRFDWGLDDNGGTFNYPFGPLRLAEALAHDGRLDDASLRSMEMTAGKAPSDFDTEIGYHLDNRRFVGYLRELLAVTAVERISCTVRAALPSADGRRVAELVTDDGRRLGFDLYLDCSGFRSVLLEGALGSPFLSYEASLFADRAVVASAAHDGRVLPHTVARKMRSGWCWTTPQRDEDHLGYVFSSRFLTEEAAAAELRTVAPGIGEPATVRFRSGRHREFWRGNVVALGNAYAFVEPLESTALHMLVRQIGMLALALDRPPDAPDPRPALNTRVGAFWDYLSWFLALHYRFDAGSKTPFWRACAEQVDVSRHAEWIESFREDGLLAADGAASEALAVAAVDPLWGAEGIDLLLLGQGVAAGGRLRPELGRDAWRQRVGRWRRKVRRAPDHAEALALLDRRPELLRGLADAFLAAGPAFSVGLNPGH